MKNLKHISGRLIFIKSVSCSFLYIILILIELSVCAGCTDDKDSYSDNIDTSDTIKVLAIGNSFSEDGIQYVYDLARAANKKIIIANLYYPGCSLAQHWSFIKKRSTAYDYQKNLNGRFIHSYNSNFFNGLLDESWDIITFQQYSGDSGLIDSYFPYLDSLTTYVKANAINSEVKIAMHQTWSYPSYSSHTGFKKYSNNQEIMYKQIVTSINFAARKECISMIIPSGTAIQNARSYFGDKLNRDDLHLSLPLGRYIASCAWFETIFGICSVGNTYIPDGISSTDAFKAQEAAHYAIMRNSVVTNISGKK